MATRRSIDRRVRPQAWGRVLLALLVALVAPGCGVPTDAPQTQEGVDLRCEGMIGLPPSRINEELATAGLAITWRYEHTTAEGSIVSDVVTSVPAGVVTDVILNGNQAIVVVVPEGDPALADAPEEFSC